MKTRTLLALSLLVIFFTSCTTAPDPPAEPVPPPAPSAPEEPPAPEPSPEEPEAPPQEFSYELVRTYPSLTFNLPVDFQVAPDGSSNVYVVEKGGRILTFPNRENVTASEVFLDITAKVDSQSSEKGLLGLAFHPTYEENGYFYVNYTDRTNTIVARYQKTEGEAMTADPESEQVLLTFPQPYANHNGGQLAFGPDGYLYISVGDGGGSGDPQDNAQDLTKVYGKLLRIDVDSPSSGKPYGIPDDNPFVSGTSGELPEIYAFGLRNPWRFSFDNERDLLWVADVGQNQIEEINIVENGGNYGWNIMEGTAEYASGTGVDMDSLIPPVYEYQHPLGRSVTGGYVYRGAITPSLRGAYIYGDFVSGKVWALWMDDARNVLNRELLSTDLSISSFGVDPEEELVILDYQGGLYRIIEKLEE
jgi:glucose/arabinose dehydrogenase